MNKYIYYTLALLMISYQSAHAMKPEPFFIKKNALFAAECLGDIALQFKGENFYVLQEGTLKKVSPSDIDPTLKNITLDQLKAFIEEGNGYIKISKMYNGQFKLESHVRGLGGCSSKWFYEEHEHDSIDRAPTLAAAITRFNAGPRIHHRDYNPSDDDSAAANSSQSQPAFGAPTQSVTISPNTERAHINN